MDEQGKTEIINAALLYMKQDAILDPAGESKNAKLCARIYDDTLAETLAGHPWSFATVAHKLRLLAEKPDDARFRYAYQLPEDVGRIIFVESADAFSEWAHVDAANSVRSAIYAVRGKRLFSDESGLRMLYTRSNVKPYEMSPQFRNYFAACIADKLFFKVVGSRDGAADMNKRMIALGMDARNTDSGMTSVLPSNKPSLFLNARAY
jgi:hypothetical protein